MDRRSQQEAESASDIQHPCQSSQPVTSTLSSDAQEFIPFALQSATFDADDDYLEHAEAQDFATRVEHLVEDQQLWSKFQESDFSGKPPPPCG